MKKTITKVETAIENRIAELEEEDEEEEEDWHYHSMEERLNEVGMSMRDFF